MNLTSRTIAAILFSAVLVYAEGQNSVKSSKLNDYYYWRSHHGSFYSIQYPPDWTLDQSGQMGSTFFLFSQLESGKDKFKENVNLMVQNLPAHQYDLDQYLAVSLQQIASVIENVKIIRSDRIGTGADSYHHLIYSGNLNKFHLMFEQFFWIDHNDALILTFTGEKSKFQTYRKTWARIVSSFTFSR